MKRLNLSKVSRLIIVEVVLKLKQGLQEEKGAAEDKLVGWHHQRDGHESEKTPGDSKGQRSLQSVGSQRVKT